MASKRLALVVGSQCDKCDRLDTLLDRANRLGRIVFDDSLGAWCPAVGQGLLIDPTVSDLRRDMHEAFRAANDNGAVLLLAYVGHGMARDGDFVLLPKDADPHELWGESAVNLNQSLKDLLRRFADVRGLIVVLDTCHSGSAVIDAADRLIRGLDGRISFDYLSSTDRREAYDCDFTEVLCDLMETGVVDGPPEMTCAYLRDEIAKNFDSVQVPFSLKFSSSDAPFLCRNIQVNVPWRNSRHAVRVGELLQEFVPVATLGEIVAKCETSRILALVGPPGAGKSTLIAALANPAVSGAPNRYVHGIVFLDEASKDYDVATDLQRQLAASFGAAWRRDTPSYEQNPLARELIHPLKGLPENTRVRIAIDALDQCPKQVRDNLIAFVIICLKERANIHFVLSSTTDAQLPSEALRFFVPEPSSKELLALMDRRGVSGARKEEILKTASGSWLVTSLLAADGEREPSLSPVIDDVYRSWIALAGDGREKEVIGILVHLVLPELGSEVPLNVFRRAIAHSMRIEPDEIDRLMQRLNRLLVHSASGQGAWVGLFHQTLVAFLRREYEAPWRGYFDIRRSSFIEAFKHVWSDPLAADEERWYAARLEPECEWADMLDEAHFADDEFLEDHSYLTRIEVSDRLEAHVQRVLQSLELRDFENRSPSEWLGWSSRFAEARHLDNVDDRTGQALLEASLTARCYEQLHSILGNHVSVDWNDWDQFGCLLGDAQSLHSANREELAGLRSRCAAVAFDERDAGKLQDALMIFIGIVFRPYARIQFRAWRRWFATSGVLYGGFDRRLKKHKELISESLVIFEPNDMEVVEMIAAIRDTSFFSGNDQQEQIQLLALVREIPLPGGTLADKEREEVEDVILSRLEAISRSAMYW